MSFVQYKNTLLAEIYPYEHIIMHILKKIILILLMLLMIYFGLGVLSCIGIIIAEASTHILSSEIGSDASPALIYTALGVFAFICAGLVTLCYVGYYYLKRSV